LELIGHCLGTQSSFLQPTPMKKNKVMTSQQPLSLIAQKKRKSDLVLPESWLFVTSL